MNKNVEDKIEMLLEDETLKENLKKYKALALAGLGGMVGAGLDTYFNGGKNIDDFIRPLAAWGLGGVIGGMASGDEKIKKNTKK